MLAFAEWLQATPFSVTIQSVTWIIPLLQSIHILMIGVVFVSILVVTLRGLGRIRMDETLDQVWARFAPWMWSALVVMAVTGLFLVVGEPVRQFTALSFWLKMTLLAVAVTSTAVFGRSFSAAAAGAGGPMPVLPAGTRKVAVATLAVWLLIIFLGRAIAYDVEVWGSLSLAS